MNRKVDYIRVAAEEKLGRAVGDYEYTQARRIADQYNWQNMDGKISLVVAFCSYKREG